jgi:tRNA1Val (adenine37-N6)-methyltransferase
MSNQYFQFKQFKVNQHLAAMKVGTDGVLLGAWFDAAGQQRLLDVGTGTGLLALMAVQRFPQLTVQAIDVDEDAVKQADENFMTSPWNDRLNAVCEPFQTYSLNHPGEYDHVVCNPPYFVQSLKAPDRARSLARHDEGLSFADLAAGINCVLKPDGIATIILPPLEMEALTALMAQYGYTIVRQLNVFAVPNKPVKRIVAAFSKAKTDKTEEDLIIESFGRHGYSDEYKQLTREFFLAF